MDLMAISFATLAFRDRGVAQAAAAAYFNVTDCQARDERHKVGAP